MKLLIATGLYAPDIGGPATYTVFLEKYLPQSGMDCVVVPYSGMRKYPRFIRHILYVLILLWNVRSVDILYALDSVSVGLPVRVVSLITRIPYMLRVPGDYAWEQGQQRFGIIENLDTFRTHKDHPIPVRILSRIQNHVARHALHIVVPSDYMKQIVHGWGIPSEKITRIYSALKRIVITKERVDLRSEYGYSNFVIVTAGRLVPWKGMHKLIDVVCMLRQSGMDVSLEILGDGICREELVERARDRNVSNHVHLRGSCTREEMASRIIASDVFVLNTSYEGFSHQLLEVMSLGTPIVTTPVGGNNELITNEQSGLLVPYNDLKQLGETLTMLYNDEALRAHLVRAAQSQVEKYAEEVVSKEFINLIRSLCTSS